MILTMLQKSFISFFGSSSDRPDLPAQLPRRPFPKPKSISITMMMLSELWTPRTDGQFQLGPPMIEGRNQGFDWGELRSRLSDESKCRVKIMV
jgi:hypothetical protein